MITIVDCGINNLRSAQKAFEHLGFATHVTRQPEEVAAAQKIVLPGVGAFGAAMKSLRDAGLIEPIVDGITAGKPFLGICLAMQLLFDWSEELGLHAGLGVVSGKVTKLPETPGLKIPHMGWSALHFPRSTKLFANVTPGSMVYFVHSYHATPDEPEVVAATCCHGLEFVAAVERDNLMAVQFHPEKSSVVGMQILDNFARL
ncbi:MAG: imidazole glycerol phosphate synthase subunit HisH [Abitibacteriaceae bacterium]|nr:imidazole glycerol phosphate synthase subunit HisH [Abditibacteriaceae bacterium]